MEDLSVISCSAGHLCCNKFKCNTFLIDTCLTAYLPPNMTLLIVMSKLWFCLLFWCGRKPHCVGIWLGLWSGLGCSHLSVWRSRITSVWQRIRGNLLQGAQDCSRQRLTSLVPTPPARCCALNCCCCCRRHFNPCHHVTTYEEECMLAHSLPYRHKFRLV